MNCSWVCELPSANGVGGASVPWPRGASGKPGQQQRSQVIRHAARAGGNARRAQPTVVAAAAAAACPLPERSAATAAAATSTASVVPFSPRRVAGGSTDVSLPRPPKQHGGAGQGVLPGGGGSSGGGGGAGLVGANWQLSNHIRQSVQDAFRTWVAAPAELTQQHQSQQQQQQQQHHAHHHHHQQQQQAARALTRSIQGCRTPDALEALLGAHWQTMDHIHVSAALVQLARQQRAGAATGNPAATATATRLATALLESASAAAQLLGSRHVSSALWAAACLGLTPAQPQLEALLDRSRALLRTGTAPQGFANLLWALATLRTDPGQSWLSEFFAASESHLPNFQAQELSSTLWALAALRVPPPPRWASSFMMASTARMGTASAQAISNLAWAAAALRLPPQSQWLAALTYAATLRRHELSPLGLSNFLWGVARLAAAARRARGVGGSTPGFFGVDSNGAAPAEAADVLPDVAGWLPQLLDAAAPQLGCFNGYVAADVAWALAALKHTPSEAFAAGLVARMGACAEQLSPRAAARGAWGAAALGIAPSAAGMSALVRVLADRLPQAAAPHLVCAASALALLRQGLSTTSAAAAEAVVAPAATRERQPMQQLEQQLELQLEQRLEQQQQRLVEVLPGSAASQVEMCTVLQQEQEQEQELQRLAAALLSASAPRLGELSGPQLCQLAGSLAAAGVQPPAEWSDALLVAAAAGLPALAPTQREVLLRSLAVWQLVPPPGWSAMLHAGALPGAAVAGAAHVGRLLQAAAAAGAAPSPDGVAALLDAALQQQQQQQLRSHADDCTHVVQHMSPAAAASLLRGLVALGFRPRDSWLHTFWAACEAGLSGSSSSSSVVKGDGADQLLDLAAVLSGAGLAALRVRPSRGCTAAIYTAASAALEGGQLAPCDAVTLLLALSAAQRAPPPSAAAAALPGQLAAAAIPVLSQLSLQEATTAWCALVELGVLTRNSAASLGVLEPTAAAAGAASAAQQAGTLPHSWPQPMLRHAGSSSGVGSGSSSWQHAWHTRVLGTSAAAELSDLDAAALLHVAVCLSKIKQLVPPAWAQAYSAAAADTLLPAAQHHELAQLLAALPFLGAAADAKEEACSNSSNSSSDSSSSNSGSSGLAAAAVAALRPKLGALSPRLLSDALAGLARASVRPPPDWLADAVHAAGAALSTFRGRELITLLAALARLRYAPGADFLAAAADAAVQAAAAGRGVHAAALVELLWALTALRSPPCPAVAARLEATLLNKGLQQLDGPSLARLAWCLAALQRRPGVQLMGALLSAVAGRLPGMDAQCMADVLWACAMLDESPGRAWLDCFLAESRRALPTASPGAVVTLLWSLALLQHRPPADWMLHCMAAVSRSLGSSSSTAPQQPDCSAAAAAPAPAATVVGGASAGCHMQLMRPPLPGALAAAAAAAAATTTPTAPPLSAQQLVRLAWSLASLNCQLTGELTQRLAQATEAHVPRLDADNLSRLVWAFDRLDATHDKQCVRRIAAAARVQLLGDEEARPVMTQRSSSTPAVAAQALRQQLSLVLLPPKGASNERQRPSSAVQGGRVVKGAAANGAAVAITAAIARDPTLLQLARSGGRTGRHELRSVLRRVKAGPGSGSSSSSSTAVVDAA